MDGVGKKSLNTTVRFSYEGVIKACKHCSRVAMCQEMFGLVRNPLGDSFVDGEAFVDICCFNMAKCFQQSSENVGKFSAGRASLRFKSSRLCVDQFHSSDESIAEIT